MSAEQDFEVVCKAWAAFGRDEIPAVVALAAEDIEIIPFGAAFQGRAYQGHEGILDWWENEILANWEWFHTLPEEFRAVGDRLLVFGRWRARGRASGVDLDVPATWVVEVRDGKIARWQTFTDRSEALESVGLTEKDLKAS
jgi:uncharacterized protein